MQTDVETKRLTLRQRISNSLMNLEAELAEVKEKYHQLLGRKQAFHDLLATADDQGHDLDSTPADTAAAAPAADTTTNPTTPTP